MIKLTNCSLNFYNGILDNLRFNDGYFTKILTDVKPKLRTHLSKNICALDSALSVISKYPMQIITSDTIIFKTNLYII